MEEVAMEIEIAWFERSENGDPQLMRAKRDLGSTFTLNTPDGLLVLVISAIGEERLTGFDVAAAVAAEIVNAPSSEVGLVH
jgi:hypothetical protein